MVDDSSTQATQLQKELGKISQVSIIYGAGLKV